MDLRTSYMGLELKHPIVASASPLSETVDGIKRLEDAGAAAVVMFSLFEEQIQQEAETMARLLDSGVDSYAESLSYFPEVDDYHVGPEGYLEILRKAREATDIPVIASLNGVSNSGWIEVARMMEEAGASAIELNIFYIPAELNLSGRDVEQRYLDVIKSVKSAVSIPLALKLGPYFSSFGDMAAQFDAAGVDALVLFNRFYQPDFDLDKLEVVPSLNLSSAAEIRLPLLWIALLYGRVKASLAATHGVHSATEVVKYLLAGADAVMTTSSLLDKGVDHLGTLVDGLEQWLDHKGYDSVSQIKGRLSQQHIADPSAYERANYIKILETSKSSYGA